MDNVGSGLSSTTQETIKKLQRKWKKEGYASKSDR